MSGGLELQFIVTVGLILVLVVAGGSDAVRYVIPNSVVLALVVLFPLAAAFAANDIAWLSHLAAGALVLVLGYPLFHYRLMGGGDIKLWAACGLWAGLDLLPIHLLNVTVIGVVLAIALVAIRAALGRVVILLAGRGRIVLPRLLRNGEAVPYGVAIAAGSILLAGQISAKFA